MCTRVQNAGTDVPQQQFVPQILFFALLLTESYQWGSVPPFLPFSPEDSSLFVMPRPLPGFNATQYHLVVAEEAKLVLGKKYCYQKKSASGSVLYGKISKVCLSSPFRVHGFPCPLPTLPLCLCRSIQNKCT